MKAALPSTSSLSGTAWFRAFSIFQSLTAGSNRLKWQKKWEFFLAAIGFGIGLSNSWRFPYVAYKSGQGAFIMPYMILLVLMGIPTLYLECILGQFCGCSPVSAFNFAPFWRGVGVTMVLFCFLVGIYSILFMVYTVRYFFLTFDAVLHWNECNPQWGADEKCFLRQNTTGLVKGIPLCSSIVNTTKTNINCSDKETAAEQLWKRVILHSHSDGKDFDLNDAGGIQWELFVVLMFCWCIVYLSTAKGIKFTGKVFYVTTTFSFLILFILMLLMATTEGASDGLHFLFVPDWKKMTDPFIWREAGTQVLLSFGLASGGQILLCSYNEFENRIHLDVILIMLCCLAGTLMSSITVFSSLGRLAWMLDIDVKDVAAKNIGFLFIIMPEALSLFPFPNLWCCLFFFMFFCMILSSQMVFADVVATVIYEEHYGLKDHILEIRVVICFFSFVIGSFCTLNGGIYVMEFMDTYVMTGSLFWIALCEIVAVSYFYGVGRFYSDIQFMLRLQVHCSLGIFWWLISPLVLMVLFLIGVVELSRITKYSNELQIVGGLIALAIILQVPFFGLAQLWSSSRTNENVIIAFQPDPRWGPRDLIMKLVYLDWRAVQGKSIGKDGAKALEELSGESAHSLTDLKATLTKQLVSKREAVFNQLGKVSHPEQVLTLNREASSSGKI